ncbi:MAG: hypothetical protein M3P33_01110 [bacterium]|nr:hypothetical protein [bacterium]
MSQEQASNVGYNRGVKNQSRRRFLRNSALSAELVLFSYLLRCDGRDPVEVAVEKELKQKGFIVEPPSQKELELFSQFLRSCIGDSNAGGGASRTHNSEGRNFTYLDVHLPGLAASRSLLVCNLVKPKGLVISFPSFDGVKSDWLNFRDDYEKLLDEGNAILFPFTYGTNRNTHGAFPDKENDIYNAANRLSENSPFHPLQAVQMLYRTFPEFIGLPVDVIGVSLGGSTALAALAMWEPYRNILANIPGNNGKKESYLPDIRNVSLYAPISSLLSKDALELFIRGELGQSGLGLGSVFDKQFHFALDIYLKSSPKGSNFDNFYDYLGLGPTINRNVERDYVSELPEEWENIHTYDAYSRISPVMLYFNLMAYRNDVSVDIFRANLMALSPSVYLQIMGQMGYPFPVEQMNISYAAFDSMVPPSQSEAVIRDLKGNGVSVNVDKLFGGHVYNGKIRRMVSYLHSLGR